MKLKSLLLGSAAALVAVSGARAADAVIIPEPEVVEYVRVCDAAGTGFFYIPGTETCLKIGGYARFEVKTHTRDNEAVDATTFFTRAALKASSWTDSEYGPVTTYFEYHMDSDRSDADDAYVDSVYFTIAGLKMGYFGSWLDNGINGETDDSGLNDKFDSIQYTGTAGAVSFGVAIDEIENDDGIYAWDEAQMGIEGMIGFTAGAFSGEVIGFYDVEAESFGVNTKVSADLGMATVQGRFIWVDEDGWDNDYVDDIYETYSFEYIVEGSVAFAVSDKLTLTPGVSYRKYYGGDEKWKYGLTADYDITDTLALKGSLQYTDFDDDYGTSEDYTGWDGMLRFTASF